ncbi:MAG: hypothetical protein ABJB74_07460 [Gemmatimonas sp.]
MARAASRKSRTPHKPISGRVIVALSLMGLLSIAALVVWRRTIAVAENRVVRALESRKRELVSARTTLENDINEASSRSHIVPAAERRLGMHVATELEVRNLPLPGTQRDSVVADTSFTDTTVVRNSSSTGLFANGNAKRGHIERGMSNRATTGRSAIGRVTTEPGTTERDIAGRRTP